MTSPAVSITASADASVPRARRAGARAVDGWLDCGDMPRVPIADAVYQFTRLDLHIHAPRIVDPKAVN